MYNIIYNNKHLTSTRITINQHETPNVRAGYSCNSNQLKKQDTYKTYTPQPSTPIKHAGSKHQMNLRI